VKSTPEAEGRLWGYCIRWATDPAAEDVAGVGGAAIELLFGEGLCLWTSWSPPPVATIENLREYQHVMASALRTGTPLPLRFGTTFERQDDARATLGARAEEFKASLRRVADRVEMSIWVTATNQSGRDSGELSQKEEAGLDPIMESPGRRYLERRRRELEARTETGRRVAGWLDYVEQELSDLALPTVRGSLPQSAEIGTLAHLVQRGELRSYRMRIAELQRGRVDVRIDLSGPWAPFSFV
jgi:hypothetical protein